MEACVERIARDDEAAEQELEALALEGLNSGESIVAMSGIGKRSVRDSSSGIKRPAPGECPLLAKTGG